MERTVPLRRDAARSGFSLTELMVAMAIFLLLMTGLATMFNAAVSSARQGYASIDAHENARSAITTMDRDLSGAFVSDEFGDRYNFYGRPEGFMFVGAMDGGVLGRVTYAFHPEVGKPGFEMEITEQWGAVVENVRRQFRREAWNGGLTGNAAIAAVNGAVAELEAQYGVFANTDLVEFRVRIETESLIRYEEPGVADLDTYDMRIDGAGFVNLAWPYVDPIDPTFDANIVSGDATFNQFAFLLGALDPTPGLNPNDDLRAVWREVLDSGGYWHPVTGDRQYLRVLGRDTFDTLLRARKREFWIRMLSGETMGILDLAPDPANGLAGYWYDEGYGVPNIANRRPVNAYVVADGIIGRAVILNAAGVPVTYSGVPLDALDAHVKFSYGDGRNQETYYFNAAENLAHPDSPDGSVDTNGDGTVNIIVPNIPTLLRAGGFAVVDVLHADSRLADSHLAADRITRANLGSPLLPRLPSVVTSEFWVTRSKTRPGAPGFKRRFVQSVQVPAATGRTPSTTIARSPGHAM